MNRAGNAAARRGGTAPRPSPPRSVSRSSTMSPQPNLSRPAPPASRNAVGQRRGAPPDVSNNRKGPSVNGDNSVVLSDAEYDESYSKATREQLLALIRGLKQEREELSGSLVVAQEAIDETKDRNAELAELLEAAQNQSQDFFTEQSRSDANLEDLQQQCDQLETQLKESERLKRDIEKRFNEEVLVFEAERATWFEEKSNLKKRVEILKARLVLNEPDSSQPSEPSSAELKPNHEQPTPAIHTSRETARVPEPINPNPELVATLAQLQADYDSLHVQFDELVLQMNKTSEEVTQLQLTNRSLQDENESFQILLGERTLTGEILGQGVFGSKWNRPCPEKLEESSTSNASDSGAPSKSSPRLAEVLEEDELFETYGSGATDSGAIATNRIEKRRPQSKGKKVKAPTDGLNLADELGRAEESANEQELEGISMERSLSPGWSEERLIQEVKALKDANKALTLYINRIVERVIASEGFEAVLASDAQRLSPPNSPSLLGQTRSKPSDKNDAPKPSLEVVAGSPVSSSPSEANQKRASSRMSLSGLASSLFGSSKPAQEEPSHLKPLHLANANSQLRSSSNSPSRLSGRSEADEEEQEESRERERIHAELALMGIEEQAGSPGLRQAQRNSIGLTLDRPMPDLPPEPHKAATKATPLSAVDQISSITERDRQGMSELKSGRASGFTEPKRVSARPRRDRPRSSSVMDHPIHGGASQIGAFGASQELPSGSADNTNESGGWGAKLLRRVSLSSR